MLPEIKGFLDVSFVDWPGRVAAVVFLARCNFRCPYCHNHRLVLAPEGLATFRLDDVISRLEELRGWVDGVCVTGGEPTLHPGLPGLLTAFRSKGMGVKLDTNGSRPEVLESLLSQGLLDAVAMDVKAPLEPIPYRRNAGQGADVAAVRRSLGLLSRAAIPVEIRTTIHPALLSREEVRRLAAEVGSVFAGDSRPPGSVRFTAQRCRSAETLDAGLGKCRPLPPEDFEIWEREAGQAFAAARGAEGQRQDSEEGRSPGISLPTIADCTAPLQGSPDPPRKQVVDSGRPIGVDLSGRR